MVQHCRLDSRLSGRSVGNDCLTRLRLLVAESVDRDTDQAEMEANAYGID